MIWYVEHPISQYNEDVKKLAKDRGLKIIDKVYQNDNKQCDNPPILTKIGEVVEVKKTKRVVL